jgi:ABC-type multidrug transport system fused ATPase/permease subunit
VTVLSCEWTGSGKSSLFAALLRLTNISSGRICIDGVDAKAVPLAALRSAVAVVPQQPLVFSGAPGGLSSVWLLLLPMPA